MKTRPTLVTSLALLVAPAAVHAHPGHGETPPDGWVHYLTEPLHVAALVALAVAVSISAVAWRRARRRL